MCIGWDGMGWDGMRYNAMRCDACVSVLHHACTCHSCAHVHVMGSCQTYEGGIGGEPGNEAHGECCIMHYAPCCVPPMFAHPADVCVMSILMLICMSHLPRWLCILWSRLHDHPRTYGAVGSATTVEMGCTTTGEHDVDRRRACTGGGACGSTPISITVHVHTRVDGYGRRLSRTYQQARRWMLFILGMRHHVM